MTEQAAFNTYLLYYILTLAVSIPSLIALVASLKTAILPLQRKRGDWKGVVYDAITKLPIPGVAVRIYSEPDGRLKEIQTTSQSGVFGFLVPPGHWSIKATHPNYRFPATRVRGRQDSVYQNIYHGELLSSGGGEKGIINVNIPMEPLAGARAVAASWYLKDLFTLIKVLILLAGTIISAYFFYRLGWWILYIVFAAYAVVWIITLISFYHPRKYGLAINPAGRPIGMVIIRALDELGRIKATVITSEEGKFLMNLSLGSYLFDASRIGYESTRTKITPISNTADLGRVTLRLEKLPASASAFPAPPPRILRKLLAGRRRARPLSNRNLLVTKHIKRLDFQGPPDRQGGSHNADQNRR